MFFINRKENSMKFKLANPFPYGKVENFHIKQFFSAWKSNMLNILKNVSSGMNVLFQGGKNLKLNMD